MVSGYHFDFVTVGTGTIVLPFAAEKGGFLLNVVGLDFLCVKSVGLLLAAVEQKSLLKYYLI